MLDANRSCNLIESLTMVFSIFCNVVMGMYQRGIHNQAVLLVSRPKPQQVHCTLDLVLLLTYMYSTAKVHSGTRLREQLPISTFFVTLWSMAQHRKLPPTRNERVARIAHKGDCSQASSG